MTNIESISSATISKSTEKNLKVVDKTLTPTEQQLVENYKKKVHAKHAAPKIKVKNNPDMTTNVRAAGESENEKLVSTIALMEAFGTASIEFQSFMMRELINASCVSTEARQYNENEINGIVAAMHSITPKDEIEGMLTNQMIATHFTAMRMLRQLKISDTIAQQDCNGNLAVKFLRTYTAQIEALQRYRSKGQQKMTVEHVHVHPGGQAIVGQIMRPEGR